MPSKTPKNIIPFLLAIFALILLAIFKKLNFETFGTTVAATTFLMLFAPTIKESFETAREAARNSPTRRLTFLILLLTTLVGLSLAIALANTATTDLIEATVVEHGVTLSFFISRVATPSILIATTGMLIFKVRSVHNLDQQKKTARSIAEAINRWASMNPNTPDVTPEQEKVKVSKYSLLLKEICGKSLHLASATGNRTGQVTEDLCAALLLPDHDDESFSVPVIVGPNTLESALLEHKAPFFKPEKFRLIYNQYYEKLKEKDIPNNREFLDEFRNDSKNYISSAGVIYEVERVISFEDLQDKCLAFRFEFLNNIQKDEREPYKFRQLVGIPVTLVGRKVGVLLLMSHRPKQFYLKDSIYQILGDLMGSAINVGLHDSNLKSFFPTNFSLENCPRLDLDSDTSPSKNRGEAVRVVKGVRHDFSVECPN